MIKPSKFKSKDKIDNWVLQVQLGAGGQAEVWSVRFEGEKHAPAAALKICTANDEQGKERLRREAKFLSDPPHHTNIVKLREPGLGEHKGQPYLLMELATTTFERLVLNADETPGLRLLSDSPGIILKLFRQACEAIAFLHEQKSIVHRDIKPSNILLVLDPKQGPMRSAVADLGIAALLAQQGELTGAQEFVGTPGFRAPESTRAHTQSSDVYSLGKTLEAILRRRMPSENGPVPCSRDPRMSEELWDILDNVLVHACHLDPGLRYSTVRELIDALPDVVLTSSRATSPLGRLPGGPVSLQDEEVLVLVATIIACVEENSGISIEALKSSTPVTPFGFSMALKELQIYGFLESFQDSDENQDHIWTAVRLLPAGIAWARKNRGMMNALWEAAQARDIPF